MGDKKLNKPVVGMVRYGDGYLMVGADGCNTVGAEGFEPPTSAL